MQDSEARSHGRQLGDSSTVNVGAGGLPVLDKDRGLGGDEAPQPPLFAWRARRGVHTSKVGAAKLFRASGVQASEPHPKQP